MTDQESLRLKARTVLHLSDPTDALYVYYALYHGHERTKLYVHEDSAGHADGFAAVCQTGQRLFQPTVALRARGADVAVDLLHQALTPGRPYYVITTPDLQDAVAEVVDIEQSEDNRIYKIELFHFRSVANVMVVKPALPVQRIAGNVLYVVITVVKIVRRVMIV